MSLTYDDLDAALTVACKDRDAYAADLRAAQEEVERLRAELAEAQATLANERGEGEPPELGWLPVDVPPGRWEHTTRNLVCYRVMSRDYIVVARGSLSGELAREKTARAAMRAAAKAVRGES